MISVDVLCDLSAFGDQPAIGYIDIPSNLQFMKGIVNFSAVELRRLKAMSASDVGALLLGSTGDVVSRDQLVMKAGGR